MSPNHDDLDALRVVVDAVKDFDHEDQKRIFRWAGEKLGLPPVFENTEIGQMTPAQGTPARTPEQPAVHPSTPATSKDIKSFIVEKNPPNDVQLATTVAYYYQFEAPESERKDSINGQDLQEACRLAGKARFQSPGNTLSNAHKLGLLDKAGERGYYAVNTVGENLVAMTLPGDGNSGGSPRRPKKKAATKKAPKKKSARKKA